MRNKLHVSPRLAFLIAMLLATPLPAQSKQPDASAPKTPERVPLPRMRIDATRGDIGTRWVDQPFEHTFRIQNQGAAPLEITGIEAPRYVRAELTPQGPIAANSQATLKVVVDSARLRSGTFERKITLTTNDPNSRKVALTIAGMCKHYIDATPYAAGFGRLSGDGHRERKITIRNRSEQPVKITIDEKSLDKSFQYQLIETVPGRVYQLFVDTKPPYAPGTLRREITLKTTHPAQSELKIGVYAIMPDRIEVLPRTISLRAPRNSEADSPRVHVLSIGNNGKTPVRIAGGSCSDPRVEVTIHEIHAGRKYRAVVKLPPDYSPPENGADVILKTNDNEIPVVTVPIGRSARRATVARATPAKNGEKTRRPKKRRPVLDMIGKPVPQYSLDSMEGARVSNAELEFHPATVLNFFAPNCPHCKRQIPKVEQLRRQFEPMGVRFVNVSEKMRKDYTPDEVAGVLADLGANLELAIDAGNKIGRRFKATGYPCLFVIRKDGVIDHVVSGNKRSIVADVTSRLNALLDADSKGETGAASTAASQ